MIDKAGQIELHDCSTKQELVNSTTGNKAQQL